MGVGWRGGAARSRHAEVTELAQKSQNRTNVRANICFIDQASIERLLRAGAVLRRDRPAVRPAWSFRSGCWVSRNMVWRQRTAISTQQPHTAAWQREQLEASVRGRHVGRADLGGGRARRGDSAALANPVQPRDTCGGPREGTSRARGGGGGAAGRGRSAARSLLHAPMRGLASRDPPSGPLPTKCFCALLCVGRAQGEPRCEEAGGRCRSADTLATCAALHFLHVDPSQKRLEINARESPSPS